MFEFRNQLVLAWTGTDGEGHLNVISPRRGALGPRRRSGPRASSAAPALRSQGTTSSCGWRGLESTVLAR